MHRKFWWGSLKEGNHLESRSKGDYNIELDLREIGWEGGDWISLAQDRDHWRSLMNSVMNLRVS
jgi:hypothetical protein